MRKIIFVLLSAFGTLAAYSQETCTDSMSIDAAFNACIAMRDAEAFADSIAEGKDVYGKADDMNRSTAHRGQTSDGSILTKTCFVKAGKSTKYSFASKGHQELAVVAEAGGLVTMKIHVTNNAGLDKRFDDTKNVKKGMPQRKTSFELPTDRRNTVELEIINCGKKDCSFVVISN